MAPARRNTFSRDTDATDGDGTGASLRHVIVVGGTTSQWSALSPSAWRERVAELGKVADHAGASWLTVRPVSDDGATGVATADRSGSGVIEPSDVEIGGCVVSVRPLADGRQRVAEAVASLQAAGGEVTEQSIAAALNAPAQADPDLVVVLGPSNHLPPSLVWELAYSELVFVEADWASLSGAHLETAIGEFARRHRRFGGVD
ncbi:MAG: hypothetical protein RI900_2576 [Actinomycetota bacterium]|jgi:Putative undecaprenyl diphosphate synthase